jgi:hypothetical protein
MYVVVRGGGRMKLDDKIVDPREWDAVRVAPGTWRGYEPGPEGLEIIVIGAPTSARIRAKTWRGQRISLWTTSTGRSPESVITAHRLLAARWSSTKKHIGSATSGDRADFSSGLPKNLAKRGQ